MKETNCSLDQFTGPTFLESLGVPSEENPRWALKACPNDVLLLKLKEYQVGERGRTGGAKASRSGSLSFSFRLFLLHLHPVLLCASRIVLTFSLAPCCPASLFPPKTLRRPGPPPRPPEDWVESEAPARPHTQASLSAASNLPSKKGIPAKGAAPASALPRPGARRAIKHQLWPLSLWPPRLAASASGLRCTRSALRQDASAAPDGSPRTLSPRLPRATHPSPALPAWGPIRTQRAAGGTKAEPTPPSLAGACGEQGEPTCWPRAEPPSSCCTWPCSRGWLPGPRPLPRVSGLELRRGRRVWGPLFSEPAVRAPLGRVGGPAPRAVGSWGLGRHPSVPLGRESEHTVIGSCN